MNMITLLFIIFVLCSLIIISGKMVILLTEYDIERKWKKGNKLYRHTDDL